MLFLLINVSRKQQCKKKVKREEKKKKPVEKGSAMQETSWNSSRLQADLDSFDIEMPKIEYSDNDNN